MPRIWLFEVLTLLALLVIVLLVLESRPGNQRMGDGEARAIECLKEIAAAQKKHRERSGRYAFLTELLGTQKPSSSLAPLLALPAERYDGKVPDATAGEGIYELGGSGYLFQVFLPSARGYGVVPGGAQPFDDEESRELWSAIAWPREFGVTGKRTIYIHHDGELFHTENLGIPYDGGKSIPSWDAGLRDRTLGMGGPPVGDRSHGTDTKIWERVGGPRKEERQKKRAKERGTSDKATAGAKRD